MGCGHNAVIVSRNAAVKTLGGCCGHGALSPCGGWHVLSGRAMGGGRTRRVRAYVAEVLSPTLRPGDIVVMDNLAPHKSAPTLALLAAAGAQVLLLPAYSPDLNPIEKMWSKIKSLLRSAEARTPEELVAAIGAALHCITPADALGWFVSCGYNFI